MGLFDEMLKDEETLFKNQLALDYTFMPKLVPYREKEQFFIANCLKPLFQERSGKNVFVYGTPGVGKTVAIRHILQELEEKSEDILPLYINCWQKNTTYKIMLAICDEVGYKFTQNKKTEDLFKIVQGILNKHAVVFVFDEVDKTDDMDFLYTFLEEIYKKCVIMITNHKEWLEELDERIKSRLTPEVISFNCYTKEETRGILKQRSEYAFFPDVWDAAAFEIVVEKTAQLKDMRSGLYLLKEAGLCAENNSQKKIMVNDVKSALEKLDNFTIKKSTDLGDEEQNILNILRKHAPEKIGKLYELYKEGGGEATYKTFQRKIAKLEKNKFIHVKKTAGGAEGNTSIISTPNSNKTLDQF